MTIIYYEKKPKAFFSPFLDIYFVVLKTTDCLFAGCTVFSQFARLLSTFPTILSAAVMVSYVQYLTTPLAAIAPDHRVNNYNNTTRI